MTNSLSAIALAQQLADELSVWIQCESPSNFPEGIHRMAELAAKQARDSGLTVNLTRIGKNNELPLLVVTNRATGDARPGILVLAHLDTVHPVGTLKDNPCRIEDDKLYGPGSYDMKGGAMLALKALGELSKPGATKLPIDFVMVPDEEVGSHASRPYIEDFAKRSIYTLVAEPARPNGGKCVTARKGTGMVHLCVKGRPSHAGLQHEKGRSAIREMAHQILKLEAMTDYDRGITVSVGTISGGTVTNTVPAHCEVMVDFRIPDMPAGEEVLARMQALSPVGPDVSLEIDVELNRPPMVKTPESTRLVEKLKGCASQAGFQLEDAPMTGGGSDANFTAALGIPSVDGLGAEGDGAHTLNEYVFVSALPRRLQFWRNILATLE
ncbi:M20 family metallopeptidase [Orrella sp. NBD-18]|uniref:M20 family metallopeptidase n=1 Tax=Sheuella amnicola TaxID=2707330 RepID=A0A6B2QVQ3_9BURK|nr:M20 family metallopeptidase [Sheuella amnicola]NDY82726.1 M20 family metallopeptidase [Sheuella amnicola]HBI84177.1 peptidase [Alcaligenaceae bacterium]